MLARTILRLSIAALSVTLPSAVAQNDCGDFVPEGEIALGVSVLCGIGSPVPGGASSPDCGVMTSNVFGAGAVALSDNLSGEICNDKPWTNGFVVGCDSNDDVTLVVQNDSAYWTCYKAEGACQVSFGGFSTGYYGKTWNCRPGA